MRGFARFLTRHAVAFVVLNLLITAVLGWRAREIRVESSLSSVLPAGDPKIAYYEQVRKTFGSDDVAVVGVRADDLFAPETLEKIDRVTKALAKLRGVERVASITNAPDPAADVVNQPRLVPHIPPSKAEVEHLKGRLRAVPLYRRNLVSSDFRGAAINVFFANLTDVEYEDLGIDPKIQAILAAEEGPEQFHFTGAGHLTLSAMQLMRRDLKVFTPIALALVLVTFALSFRSLRGVALPAASVLMALSWTLGVMVLLGKPITLGTFVLPALLLVVGSSYAIHVVARYYEQIDAGTPQPEIVLRAFDLVWLPLAISAGTTIIGFGSLMTNRIIAIYDLGLFAVVGIVFLTITSLTFLPAALELLPVRAAGGSSDKASPRLARALRRLGKRIHISSHPILVVSGLAGLVGLLGATLIRVDSNFLGYFQPNSPVRLDNEIINRDIVGSNPFYLIVETSEDGALKRWEVLKLMKDLQRFLYTLPGVTSTLSFVDYLEIFETGLNAAPSEGDFDDQGNPIPAGPPLKPFWQDPQNLTPVLQLVATNPKAFRGVVTSNYRSGSILVRTNLTGSREIEATLDRIHGYVKEQFPSKIRVVPTGNLVLLTGTASDIVAGQIKSLSIALAVILAILSLMFLSLKVGLLATAPNVLPIVIFFGLMGWFGIALNLGTSLIAAISLGIAVDSTIHYMSRLNTELKGAPDQVSAIVETLRIVGAPILFATVALFFGFLTFAFSSFVPIQQFGVLAASTMATALLTNIFLLPALLGTTKIITVWDLLAVKLGKDPARTIPLFAGLRPGEARIVILMGEIKRFTGGEMIIRQGDVGNEMYVIIQGTTDVYAGEGAERRKIAAQTRGDVFGEMGLVRRIERSADVVANGEVEVLAVDEHFLRRIQFRYPRIASKVFLNLTRILSDRLERMTDQFVGVRPTPATPVSVPAAS